MAAADSYPGRHPFPKLCGVFVQARKHEAQGMALQPGTKAGLVQTRNRPHTSPPRPGIPALRDAKGSPWLYSGGPDCNQARFLVCDIAIKWIQIK